MLAWLAKSALMQSPVGTFLKAVPRWLWLLLIGAALAALAWWRIAAAIGDAREEGHAAGKAEVEAYYARKAAEWVVEINDIATKRKEKNRAANQRIDWTADALLLRGPGKAACPYPAAPVAGGGPDPGRGAGPAAVAGLPDEGRPVLAAVPYDDFVAVQRFCALNRQEVIDRRAAEQEQLEAWRKLSGAK